jgi:catalase
MDEGVIALKAPSDAKRFVEACRKLRFWEREAKVHAV